MQNDGIVAQKPRAFTMNALPLPLKYTTLMLSSYSVTTVIEIHKKHFFMVLRDSSHYLPYWLYCFEFICWRIWLVFPCYGSFTVFKRLMFSPCFFPCNNPLQKLIFLISTTCQVHDRKLHMLCFLIAGFFTWYTFVSQMSLRWLRHVNMSIMYFREERWVSVFKVEVNLKFILKICVKRRT